jgi:hypothetical protein
MLAFRGVVKIFGGHAESCHGNHDVDEVGKIALQRDLLILFP